MRRRAFVGVLCGAAVWPLAVLSQPKRTSRIGFLGLSSPTAHARFLEAFRRGLRHLGYVEGQNISESITVGRKANTTGFPQLATELTQADVQLVVTYGSEGALAAKRTIINLPIVAVSVGDFVGAGLVTNLARPEANVTGLSLLATEISGKRLGLLRETVPRLEKIAILWNPGNASVVLKFKAAEAAARALGYPSHRPAGYRPRCRARPRNSGRRTGGGRCSLQRRRPPPSRPRGTDGGDCKRVSPTFGERVREMAEAGGLWSYGPDLRDIFFAGPAFTSDSSSGRWGPVICLSSNPQSSSS